MRCIVAVAIRLKPAGSLVAVPKGQSWYCSGVTTTSSGIFTPVEWFGQ